MFLIDMLVLGVCLFYFVCVQGQRKTLLHKAHKRGAKRKTMRKTG